MLKNNEILETYGPIVLSNIRKHEEICKKIGRYRSHLKFCLQCKHCNITPKGLKIKAIGGSDIFLAKF